MSLSRKQLIVAEASRLINQMAGLVDRPDEPNLKADVSVVTFQKTFGRENKFSFVAVQCTRDDGETEWQIVGQRADFMPTMSWDELLDFASKDEPQIPAIWLVESYAPLNPSRA
jgi:hypothetical protein